jgi:TetR/AcrR family transcriptional regulator, mexJK operon transcriptional repressor
MSKPPPTKAPPVPPFLMGDDKRTTILRAAHRLFLSQGYTETSMDAVTSEAGVSKATVYAHFDSKDKLFETLVKEGSQNALKATPALERRGGNPREELLSFFEPFLGLVLGKGGYAWERLMLAEANRHPEKARFFYSCTMERIGNMVASYLQKLADEGLFDPKQVKPAAEALVSLVMIGPIHRTILLGKDAVDYRQTLRYGVELILRQN